IPNGKCVAILGKSGSGKSTLLNMIGGVDKPSRGEILINNENILNYSSKEITLYRRRMVGFVYQNFNLISVLNVRENIFVPIRLDNRKVDSDHFEMLVECLGIGDILNKMPDQISGGQKQRVAIARAMIHKPALVLADEPTGNLDSENSNEVINLLLSCRKRFAQTMMIVTHDLQIAQKADEIITIKDGHIV
ncbi:MAG: ABC transporter ATP-binding protein, partial [Eubacterium sp.]